MRAHGSWLALLAVAALTLFATPAGAQVVALGASNTAGYGVGGGQSYPAHLEAMLRAQGHAVSVRNSGISGDTIAGMLARLDSAVPSGTRVVILDPGNNDIKACTEPWRPQRCATQAQHDATVAAVRSRLGARGIRVFMANIWWHTIPRGNWLADRRHLTVEGQRFVAARLAPQVAAALGRR